MRWTVCRSSDRLGQPSGWALRHKRLAPRHRAFGLTPFGALGLATGVRGRGGAGCRREDTGFPVRQNVPGGERCTDWKNRTR